MNWLAVLALLPFIALIITYISHITGEEDVDETFLGILLIEVITVLFAWGLVNL
jgi:hypothetical protein